MTYERKSGFAYKPKTRHMLLSPVMHKRFRDLWETNLDIALSRVEALKRQGWNADVERGALMESQAKRLTQSLKSQGCEVEVVPVTEWAGEKVVFIAYKPGKQPPPPPKQPATTPPKAAATTEQIRQRFIKEWFPKGQKPEPGHELLDGCVMEPHRRACFIPRDAIPENSGSLKTIVENAQEFYRLGTPKQEINNTPNLLKVLRRAKKIGQTCISLDKDNLVTVETSLLIKALKSLGKGKIRIYFKAKDNPAYLINSEGDTVVIAPHLDAPPSVTAKLEFLKDYKPPP